MPAGVIATTSGSPVRFVLDLSIRSLPEPSGQSSTSSQVMAAASERLSPASLKRRQRAISILPRRMALSLASGRPPLDRSLGKHGGSPYGVQGLREEGGGLLLRLGPGAHALQSFGDDPVPARVLVIPYPPQPESVYQGAAGQTDGGDAPALEFQMIQVPYYIGGPGGHRLQAHLLTPMLESRQCRA